jgi:membrane fusion protein (multidrug efflux system)
MTGRGVILGVLLVAAGVAVGAVGARWLAASAAHGPDAPPEKHDESAAKEAEPAALVKTTPVTEGAFQPIVEALGSAIISPAAVTVVSWPAELAVVKVLVVQGQSVEKDAPIVRATLTPDAALQLSLAQQAADSTARTLEAAQARVDRGLATRQELITAQAAADDARRRAQRLRAATPPEDGLIRAPAPGTVQTVRAQSGSVVAPNAPIADLAPSDSVVVQLGVEPTDAAAIAPGQHVTLTPLDAHSGADYEATITLIAPTMNATTRLVDVTAAVAGPAPRPGTMLQGRIHLPEVHAFTLPPAAVVPGGGSGEEGDEDIVFIVRDGKAVRTPVKLGRRFGDRIEVTAGCTPGDAVVVMGQWQLTDGAPVRIDVGAATREGDIDGH